MSATARANVMPATPDVSANLRARFATNLRLARRKARLTQEQVAERTHLTQPRVSEAENDVRNITLETMAVLANAIGVEAWRLLTPPRRRATRRR